MRGVARDAVFENPRLRGGPRRRDDLRPSCCGPAPSWGSRAQV